MTLIKLDLKIQQRPDDEFVRRSLMLFIACYPNTSLNAITRTFIAIKGTEKKKRK